MPMREMKIDRGLFKIAMAEEHLDGAQIGSAFEHVRGKAMTQGLLVLLMICTQQRFAIGSIRSTASKLK
jgi:hypothetical protein